MMIRRVLCAFLLAILSAPANAAQAEVYATVGNWTVAYYSTLNGCFALTTYNSGTALRIGFTGGEGMDPNYVVLGNYSWSSIEVGKDYELTLKLDGATPWKVTAEGSRMGDLPTMTLSGTNFGFMSDFVKKHFLTVYFGDREVGTFSLKDSAKAAAEMSRCQTEAGAVSKDPFSKGPSRTDGAKDPFAI